jgi:hypothetical protein
MDRPASFKSGWTSDAVDQVTSAFRFRRVGTTPLPLARDPVNLNFFELE